MKPKLYIPFAIGLFLMALFFSVTVFKKNTGACISIGMVGIVALFFSLFEARKTSAEKIVLIALLSSAAAAGRVLFASIPSVQPASFLIIMSGIVFGAEVGFLTGAITALASNLMLGQGPWTVWQMLAWGLMGFVSALARRALLNSRALFFAYGLLWGFLFGWIMNVWMVFGGFLGEPSRAAILSVYAASFSFDLAHGVANLLLIALLGKRFYKILGRISIKYGLGAEYG